MKQYKFHRLKYLAKNHEKCDILYDSPLGNVVAAEKYILADSQPQNNSQQKQALHESRAAAQYFRCRSRKMPINYSLLSM